MLAVYRGLMAQDGEMIAIAGDSARDGMTLSLFRTLYAEGVFPAGAAGMSPWTDRGLTGASLASHAYPIFARGVLRALADSYAQGGDKADPRISPLHAALEGLRPIRIDVGDDEVVLDDSIRLSRGPPKRKSISQSIWAGMPRVFQSNVGRLRAVDQSLDAIGAFLSSRLDVQAGDAIPSTSIKGA